MVWVFESPFPLTTRGPEEDMNPNETRKFVLEQSPSASNGLTPARAVARAVL